MGRHRPSDAVPPRRWRRGRGAPLLALLALAIVLVPASPAAAAGTIVLVPASPAAAAGRGFATLTRHGAPLTADRPGTIDVRVVPGGRHAGRLYRAVRRAVASQRRYGIAVRFGGWGDPHGADGTITVREVAGCGGEDGWTEVWLQTHGAFSEVMHSESQICGPAWQHPGRWADAVVLHELGHAVGLAHYDGRYLGQLQAMNCCVFGGRPGYRAGDVLGLRLIAARTALLRVATTLGN